MKRIPTPDWARQFEISFANKDAGEAFFAFAPHFAEVLTTLHSRLEDFVDDPERTFSDEDESFPKRSEISGEYYFSDVHFDSNESKDTRAYFGMSIMVHCLGKGEFENETNLDYLGLEMQAYVWKDTGALEIEEGFNTSSL